MIEAAAKGDLNGMNHFLNDGIDVNARDSSVNIYIYIYIYRYIYIYLVYTTNLSASAVTSHTFLSPNARNSFKLSAQLRRNFSENMKLFSSRI